MVVLTRMEGLAKSDWILRAHCLSCGIVNGMVQHDGLIKQSWRGMFGGTGSQQVAQAEYMQYRQWRHGNGRPWKGNTQFGAHAVQLHLDGSILTAKKASQADGSTQAHNLLRQWPQGIPVPS